MCIYVCDINKLKKLSLSVSTIIKKGSVILLNGELGTGKTTFVRLLVEHLHGNVSEVSSPTFNLLHKYETKYFDIWHFDLYRLKSSEELYNIGIEDALMNGVSVLEWGDMAKNILGRKCIEISFQYTENINTRKIIINSEDLLFCSLKCL